jgi:hypothetical protein
MLPTLKQLGFIADLDHHRRRDPRDRGWPVVRLSPIPDPTIELEPLGDRHPAEATEPLPKLKRIGLGLIIACAHRSSVRHACRIMQASLASRLAMICLLPSAAALARMRALATSFSNAASDSFPVARTRFAKSLSIPCSA